jgi:YD repeat-containing protein
VIAALAACDSPSDHKLPGASPMPQPARHPAPPACGDDVAVDGDTIHYAYAYDDHGRLAHVVGSYATGGADETIDYGYDNLGHLMRLHDVRGETALLDVTTLYDSLGDLIVYDYVAGNDTRYYVMSAFDDAGQPTAQVVSLAGQAGVRYELDYDDAGRLARTVAATGSTTTYSYDDDGRTLTIDTDAGAFHGEIAYDERDRELFETWGGRDPNAVPSETDYAYAGDRMTSVTYRQGAPLVTLQTDTLRYCD